MQYTNSPFFELAQNGDKVNLGLRYSDFDFTNGCQIACSVHSCKKEFLKILRIFRLFF